MKRILILISLPLLFASCGAWKHSKGFDYSECRNEEYLKQLESTPDKLIIDVRTPSEYRKGHIKGAINISYFSGDYGKYVDTLDHTKPAFIYCQTQHRSPLSAKIMKKKGFHKVVDLTGGFMKWENGNMPIEK